MATSYTVKQGDTLSEIAEAHLSGSGYSSTYAYVDYLVKLNNIKDPDYIVVGQKIALSSGGESSTSGASSVNNTSRAKINVFGLQSNTDRTMYVTWTWSKSNTENYQVIWYYDTGDNVWFIGTDTKVTDNQSLYTAPTNALKVKVKVKPISKTKTVDNKTTSYWTASWSTEKTYSFSNNPPKTPSTPTVSIKNFTLTAEFDNLDLNATHIEFQIVKNNTSVFNTGKATITNTYASYSCTVTAGAEYKVRCRSVRGSLYSDWSQYSSNVGTIPDTPFDITTCRAASETSVFLAWASVDNATSYDLEYATKLNYFDGSDQTTTVNGITTIQYEKTGLTSGEEYFFRVRAVNEKGHSGWTAIHSVIIGKAPAAPTTWSSTTTAITGDPLILYWVHNAEDGSKQKYAEIELYIDGDKETMTVRHTETDDDDDETNKTNSVNIPTIEYTEGTIIKWRVRTSGITNEYGEWSIQRTVTVYAPPTLEFSVTDASGNWLDILESFPFYVSASAGPNSQNPIGYHLTITANEGYETIDNIGNTKMVSKGDQIYSRYFDDSSKLSARISASDVSLENNIRYTVTCLVSMDSGLTTETSSEFGVAWTEEEFEPNAEIGVNTENYTAFIKPYCRDIYGQLIDGVRLSVYRREFDGSFTELGSDLDNNKEIFVTDPHPALDYARYRIVATTVSTGTVSYYDVPGYPVGGIAVILQWDEHWSNFDSEEENELEQRTWSGSMLKLPYNIDVSDSNKPDIALVEYIGRKYPVSYYGTQLGTTSTWSMMIPKYDKETLYALRRLSIWMGDVYVREPSGSGYWANVTVSFSQKHLDTVIPVSLNITRVAGGV